MMENTLIIDMKTTIDIEFIDKVKATLEIKDKSKLEDCENDKRVMLNFLNGESYIGFFKGIDEEEIILQSILRNNTVGLPLNMLKDYAEEVS